MEILSIKLSRDQQYIAAMAGYILIKEIEEIHQILVYKINSINEMELVADVYLDDKYKYCSKTFDFCYRKDVVGAEGKSLLLLDKSQIFCLKYMETENNITTIYKFENVLEDQPDYAVFSDCQRYAIIATSSDALWVNLIVDENCIGSQEYDLDELYYFGDIKCLSKFNNKFYILANRLNNKLGQFLFEIPQVLSDDHIDQDSLKFVLKHESRLEIGDGTIDFCTRIHNSDCRGHQAASEDECPKEQFEIITSFKSIYESTFTVFIIMKQDDSFTI